MIASAILLAASAHVSRDQKVLDRISVSCGLSAGDITIKQGRLVRIHSSQAPSYQAVMCVLPKLNKSGFIYPVGFISEPSKEPKH